MKSREKHRTGHQGIKVTQSTGWQSYLKNKEKWTESFENFPFGYANNQSASACIMADSVSAHTWVPTLEYMAPLRTSPLRIQMMEAAGLALSAWQVRLSGSPARRLTTGPPLITGSSGGTAGRVGGDRKGVSPLILSPSRSRKSVTCTSQRETKQGQ